MAASGRKAAKKGVIPASKMAGEYGVPAGYDAVLPREGSALKEGVANKSARLSAAVAAYNDALKESLKKGMSEADAVRSASKQLDGVSELVKRHAIEAKDGDPTVVADIASALMSLDPGPRSMVLRRAGNPEIFSSLDGGELASTPSVITKLDEAAAKSKVEADEKDLAKSQDRSRFDQEYRPAQVLTQQGKVTKSGKRVKPSAVYKDHMMQDRSALDVDTAARREIIDRDITVDPKTGVVLGREGGRAEAAKIPLNPSQRRALNDLAGDQIAQVKAIEKKGMTARLPRVVGKTKDYGQDVLTVGTSQGGGGLGDDSARWSGSSGRPLDREVAMRNLSPAEKLLELMYSMTQPVPKIDPKSKAGDVSVSGRTGLTQMEAPADTWINLNEYFPLFRARIGELTKSGKYRFPSEAPTPEWLTGFMGAVLNVQDPDWMPRMLPLVTRSLEKTPASAGRVLIEGGGLQTGRSTLRKKNAAYYDQQQFVPGTNLRATMQKGLDGKGKPITIYGDKTLAREPLEQPALTPTPQDAGGGGKISEDATNRTLDRINQMREKMRKQAGNGDTASIYMVPDNSPVRSLMV